MRGLAAAGMRERSARLVWGLHSGVTLFFLVASLLPWRWALWSAIAAAFVMPLQWHLNGGVCVLTSLEHWLRGTSVGAATGGSFIGGLMTRLVGVEPSDRCVDTTTYAVLWVGAVVAALRLALE